MQYGAFYVVNEKKANVCSSGLLNLHQSKGSVQYPLDIPRLFPFPSPNLFICLHNPSCLHLSRPNAYNARWFCRRSAAVSGGHFEVLRGFCRSRERVEDSGEMPLCCYIWIEVILKKRVLEAWIAKSMETCWDVHQVGTRMSVTNDGTNDVAG